MIGKLNPNFYYFLDTKVQAYGRCGEWDGEGANRFDDIRFLVYIIFQARLYF
jgi:hypothetical protein